MKYILVDQQVEKKHVFTLLFLLTFGSYSFAFLPINKVDAMYSIASTDTTIENNNNASKPLNTTSEGTPKSTISTFYYTGADQSFTVPSCVTKVKVYMWGAGGGSGDDAGNPSTPPGGGGGFVSGELSVTPGENLTIIVGEGGKFGTAAYVNTYGGGGKSGRKPFSGSGGGRSAIRRGSTELATAGGGGGGGETRARPGTQAHGGSGGAGGGLIANAGSAGLGNLTAPGVRGGGAGSQASGGAGGIGSSVHYPSSDFDGTPGSQFQGGSGNEVPAGQNIYTHREGGGGGGGYFGGGGGAGQGNGYWDDEASTWVSNNNGAAGGGGGSSYIEGLLSSPTPINEKGGAGPLPNNSQQEAANASHPFNNHEYGSGAKVNKDGQDGLIVIEIVETAEPTATITSVDADKCHGAKIQIEGTVSTIGNWTLTLNNGATITGSGNENWSRSISPTSTTTYTISSLTSTLLGSCPTTLTGSTTVTLPTIGTGLAKNGESSTCEVNGNDYIHFHHTSGRLIGSINPNGQDLGDVTMTMYDDGTSQLIPACNTSDLGWANSVMNRHWLVSQTIKPNNNVDVRLPFTDADYTDLEESANNNRNQKDDIAGIGSIRLSEYIGLNENNSALDNCNNGTTLVYLQSENGDVVSANNYPSDLTNTKFIQFNSQGFSELWLHGATYSPLPVELTNFSAECGEEISINWSTESETNSDKFIVEKSRDAKSWTVVGTQSAAGNSSVKVNYTLTDEQTLNSVSYYRLRQIDIDGAATIYGPISASCKIGENNMIVYPNPTNGKFNVEINSLEKTKDAQLVLIDMSGRRVESKLLNITKGINEIYFDHHNLNRGVYTIQLFGVKNGVAPVKVVIR